MLRTRGRVLLLIVATAVVVPCAAWASTLDSTSTGSAAAGGGTVSFRMSADWTNFDYQVVTNLGTSMTTAYAYDSLVAWGPYKKGKTPEIVPYLARSWKITPTSVTFTLKKGPTCQDGTPITPRVVKASLDRMLTVSTTLAAAFGGTQNPASGIGPFSVTANERAGTVTFRSTKPSNVLINGFLPFHGGPTYMGVAKIVCPSGLRNPDALKTGMYGSGPYRLVSAKQGDELVFELWDKWTWGPNGTSAKRSGMPDRLVIKVVTDETTAVNLALTGQLDALQVIASGGARLLSSGQFKAVSGPALQGQGHEFGGMRGVFFNATKPVTAEPNLRKALTMVLNVSDFNRAFTGGLGGFTPVLSPTVPGSQCYSAAVARLHPKGSVAEARALLQRAGYTYRGDDLYNPGGERVRVRYLSVSSDTAIPYVVRQWSALGVDVSVNAGTITNLSATSASNNWDTYYANFTGIGLAIGPQTPVGNNRGFPQTPAFEREVNQALGTTGATSCRHWQNVARMTLQNAYFAPINVPNNVTFVRKNIAAPLWGPNAALGSIPSWTVSK